MKMLLLNALKGLKSKKIQMIAIIFMVMLSTMIFTAMNTALDRMEDRYHNYLKEQNVEDFSFVPTIDYSTDYTKSDIEELKKNELKDLPEEQMKIINTYEMTLGMPNIPNVDKLYEAVEYIMNANGANTKKLQEKIAPILDKYDFKYYVEKSKLSTENKYIYKTLVYDSEKQVNIPYLVEGRFPEADNEITVLPGFAKNNDIKVGDNYKMGDKEYKVVGFAFAPDHIFPLLSFNSPIFDEKTNNISYMTENTFKEFAGLQDVSYIGAFNESAKIFEFEEIYEMFENETVIEISPMSVARLIRVNAFEMELESNRLFAQYFLYLLLTISVFIILVITKKRIDDERLQIGVLKALGYKSYKIALSYLVYPIVGSIIGGAIGYFAGIAVHPLLSNIYLSYYNLPISGYEFSLQYLYISIFIPMILLSLLAFVIAIFMLRKKPLQLLKEGSNLKVNFFSKFVSWVTRKLPFKSRFRYSLASRSLGKLFIVTLTSFCTGLLIVLILIGMNMFNSMLDKTFSGLNYDNVVSYLTTMHGTSSEEDYTYDTSLTLKSVEKSDGSVRNVDRKDDYSVTLSGIEKNPKFLSIKSDKGDDLSEKLVNDSDIVINTNIAEISKAEIGDTLLFKQNDTEYRYKVVGIQESFMGSSAYVKRSGLSKLFDNSEDAYNSKYTTDDKYQNMSSIDEKELSTISNIFSIKDLKNNMEKQMATSSASLYFVIAFAGVMALIIIAVIANIVVEENKKTISLMKVMGYKNKSVSSIVLNIYTPFVIVAYLLSIPAMQSILKFIANALTKDMAYAIPIDFSLINALIGLLVLLIGYYIAITISRHTLNKVPLSIALKRE